MQQARKFILKISIRCKKKLKITVSAGKDYSSVVVYEPYTCLPVRPLPWPEDQTYYPHCPKTNMNYPHINQAHVANRMDAMVYWTSVRTIFLLYHPCNRLDFIPRFRIFIGTVYTRSSPYTSHVNIIESCHISWWPEATENVGGFSLLKILSENISAKSKPYAKIRNPNGFVQ